MPKGFDGVVSVPSRILKTVEPSPRFGFNGLPARSLMPLVSVLSNVMTYVESVCQTLVSEMSDKVSFNAS
jgi:hypothetical protein